MDFTEILSRCGWDFEAAHEEVKDTPPVEYPPDVLRECLGELAEL